MNYLVRSLKDAIATQFDAPKRTAYVYFRASEGASLGAGMCEMPAGSSNERHTHDFADEVIHIVRGTFRFVFPGDEVVLHELDCIFIPRGLEHQIFNIGTETAFHTFTFTDVQATELIVRRYDKEN